MLCRSASGSLRLAVGRRQLVAGDHRTDEYLRQPLCRCLRRSLSEQIRSVLDVRLARGADRRLPGGTEDGSDFLPLRRGAGFSWLATVPPTAAIAGKLFGLRYLGMLFGMTMLSHQIGGFFSAYLGGLALTQFGDYGWMWYADIALAAVAALLNLPIREAALPSPAV
jgi:hypothetical protein